MQTADGYQVEASASLTCVSTELQLSAVSVTNTTISPNADLNRANTFILYTVSTDAQMPVKVFSGATALRTLTADTAARVAGAYGVEWDGNYDSGSVVPDGSYTYTVTAYDPVLGTTVDTTGYLVVDTTRPDLPVIITPREEADTDGNSDGSAGIAGVDDDADGLTDLLTGSAGRSGQVPDGRDRQPTGTLTTQTTPTTRVRQRERDGGRAVL